MLSFLTFESWSPRFDSNFYSLKLEHKENLQFPPHAPDENNVPPGKNHHPAYYYRIDVFRKRRKHSIFRRYSQFRWLYEQVASYKPPPPNRTTQDGGEMPPIPPIPFPPKTCPWQTQDDRFAQVRLEELRAFLTDALLRPGIASHPAVVKFLGLNELDDDGESQQQQQQH